jgi:PhnB protein
MDFQGAFRHDARSFVRAAEADRLFNALVEGGTVTQPLTKTFFSPRFGMLADKFGVHWIVIAAQ